MAVVIRPNTAKVFLINILIILSLSVVLIVLLLILELIDVLKHLSIFGFDNILQLSIMAVFFIGLFSLIVSYVHSLNTKYEFMLDKIITYKPIFFFFRKKNSVSYRHLSDVDHIQRSYFDKVLHTGSIILDVSSMGKKSISINFVDNYLEKTNYVKDILRSYNLKVHAEFVEKYELKNTLEKKGL